MVDVADAAVVAILTRAPGTGGKSRLFAELGMRPDPALLTALLLDTLDGTNAPGVRRIIFVDPPEACADVHALVPRGIEVRPQSTGTLGNRMHAAMTDLFDRGARAVVLVGSDLPEISARIVSEAFDLLAADPETIVLGPADDGGYYLIGAARTTPPVFDGIAWGSADVLAQTAALAGQRGLSVALVDRLADVDRVADLRRVRAARTGAWVRAHLRQE